MSLRKISFSYVMINLITICEYHHVHKRFFVIDFPRQHLRIEEDITNGSTSSSRKQTVHIYIYIYSPLSNTFSLIHSMFYGWLLKAFPLKYLITKIMRKTKKWKRIGESLSKDIYHLVIDSFFTLKLKLNI